MIEIHQSLETSPIWWFNHRHEIDLEPKYQRKGGLWKVPDRQLLIDSILNGYDIPKFYLADFTTSDSPLNEKRLPYAVIDGKQRLLALFQFMSGDLPLASNFIYARQPELELSGLSYPNLLERFPKVAEHLSSHELAVMSVVTDEESAVRQLFIRLNRGLPLVGSEVRNAMLGKMPDVVRKLVEHKFFAEWIRFPTSRGQDLNAAAKLLNVEFRGELTDTKKKTLDGLASEIFDIENRGSTAASIRDMTSKLNRAEREVEKVLASMMDLFQPRESLLSSPGQLPVYYWLVRELDPDAATELPAFLRDFERLRSANRKIVIQHPEEVDRELLQFDLYNRNTNDKASMTGRYEILYRRFVKRSLSASS